MAARFRFETLVECPLGTLSQAALQRLVSKGVSEDTDIDFKEALYGNGDRDKIAFAVDVAALANFIGGVLLVGVREDDKRASELTPVEISDTERSRMHQLVVERVFPLPEFEILEVDGDEAGQGFFVVAVQRTTQHPHAVRVDKSLSHPFRNGPATHYFTESMVADAYRNRFAAAHGDVERLAALQEGRNWLDGREKAWVTATLLPTIPGKATVNNERVRGIREWLRQREWPVDGSPRYGDGHTGRRRILVLDSPQDRPGWADSWRYEFHDDGSSFLAEVVGYTADDGKLVEVGHNTLLLALIRVIHLACDHAFNVAGASGDALLRVQLTSNDECPSLGLWGFGIMQTEKQIGIWTLKETSFSDHTVAPSVVLSSASDLLSVAREVATDIYQEFGVAEVSQIDAAGNVLPEKFGSGFADVARQWARAQGVLEDADKAGG